MKKTIFSLLLLSVMSMTAWAQGTSNKEVSEGEKYFQAAKECYKAKDYEGFFKNSKKAAGCKHPEGTYDLSICYSRGWGTKKDMKKYVQNLEKAANYGYTPAYNEVGVFYDNCGDRWSHMQANSWYQKAINAGDGWGSYNMAYNYYTGRHGVDIPEKAARLYADAVESKNSDVQDIWRSILRNKCFTKNSRGKVVYTDFFKNYPDAAYAYEYANWKMNPDNTYIFTESIKMNSERAAKVIQALADNGDYKAIKMIHANSINYKNKYLKKDVRAAVDYFIKEDDKVEYDLQDMMIVAKGEGLFTDELPQSWYKRNKHTEVLYDAARQGNAEAQYARALECELQGSYYDYRDWCKRAADKGHKLAAIRYNQIVTKEKQEENRRKIAEKQQEAERQRLAAQAEKIRVEKFKKCQPGDIVYYSKKRSWEEGILFFKSAKEASCEIVCYVEKNVNNGERVQVRVADVKRSGDRDLEAVIDGVEFRRDEVKWIRPLRNKNWQIE